MERVTFLVERTGERIGCLLNPETLTVQRRAGLAARGADDSGPIRAAGLSDDPLVYTGAGSTELTLDLLFDTTLAAGSTAVAEDVRVLTAPLCALAEHAVDVEGRVVAPFVRFLWGLSWNIHGVVGSVAERLESFTATGVPRRSWLRMRLLRVTAPAAPAASPIVTVDQLEALRASSADDGSPAIVSIAGELPGSPQLDGGAEPAPVRLDELAHRTLGDARLWRLLAWANDVADPFHVSSGAALRVPRDTSGAAVP